MNTISISYSLIWQFKDMPNYKISKCKKIFNCKNGKQIKCVLNGGSIGYWIGGNFIPKSKINDKIEVIPKIICPF